MRPSALPVIAPVLWLAAAAGACAATLQVTVTGADGRPAADAVVMVQAAGAAQVPVPAAPVVVEQRDIRFVPYVAVVRQGGSVRFVNRDGYDHHIRSLPGGPLGNVAPAKALELRLAPARKSGDASEDIRLDLPGPILLGCHLHGSMRGHLLVSASPWFAVSDDKGQLRIEGLPDGAVAELRLWHPDQILDQAAQRVDLAGAATAQLKLNFSPRRRPPPRRADQEYGPPGSSN